MVLVPAVMQLLGDRNWWIPDWLERILPGWTSSPLARSTPRRPAHAGGAPSYGRIQATGASSG